MKKLLIVAIGVVGLFAVSRAHHRARIEEEEARFWGDA